MTETKGLYRTQRSNVVWDIVGMSRLNFHKRKKEIVVSWNSVEK